jgi:hypothetical protein
MSGKTSTKATDNPSDVLKDLLIVHLFLAGVDGHGIRKILGCDMNRVTRIIKPLKTAEKKSRRKGG